MNTKDCNRLEMESKRESLVVDKVSIKRVGYGKYKPKRTQPHTPLLASRLLRRGYAVQCSAVTELISLLCCVCSAPG